MGLFRNKSKWTKETAPSEKNLLIEGVLCIKAKNTDMFGSNPTLVNVHIDKTIPETTDSNINDIMKRIEEELSNIYTDICEQLEQDKSYFTNGFLKQIKEDN